jgi:hypothetical protein
MNTWLDQGGHNAVARVRLHPFTCASVSSYPARGARARSGYCAVTQASARSSRTDERVHHCVPDVWNRELPGCGPSPHARDLGSRGIGHPACSLRVPSGRRVTGAPTGHAGHAAALMYPASSYEVLRDLCGGAALADVPDQGRPVSGSCVGIDRCGVPATGRPG